MFLTNQYLNYLIIIAVLLILIGVISILINKSQEKQIYNEIEAFCIKNNYTYTKVNNQKYDFEIKNDLFDLKCVIVKIPSNSSVTINSKNTWCLRFGGGKRHGRNYPNKRYMNELVPFLNQSYEGKIRKVIILYPSTEVILKYLNESEICEVKTLDTPYGYKVISYNKLYEEFNDLIK